MSYPASSEVKFEIGHVLFIDIVGYSKLLITEQSEQLQTLKQIVRGTEQFRLAEAEGKLLRLPTGDGGALVFRTSPEAPVLCALEISRALKSHPELRVRMGIHSGPVNEITDLNEHANIAGAGINIAQRVMDCGDAGHILLSKRVADDLEQYPQWRSHLVELGEREVKHGVRISIVNLYTEDAGNPEPPHKLGPAEASADPGWPRQRLGRWIAIGVALCVIAVGASMIINRHQTPRDIAKSAPAAAESNAPAADNAPEKSIAVLPFENLSDDKENAYFADGVQDDILTNLSKIAELKVISRTSVMSYRGTGARNIREIGKALGVATVLEGSVRRAGNRVRVNVQLINAKNDHHVWAEDYDRDLTDVFAIQTDLAQKISSALQAKLAPAEQAILTQQPTTNSNAYLLYIQANGYRVGAELFLDSSLKAESLYESAIKLDPNFALAYAGLSEIESWLYHTQEPTALRRDKAQRAAEKALELNPELPEAHLALGFTHYYGHLDYARALQEFEIAKTRLPNDAQVFLAIGAIQRRQGKWQESTANLERAAELDPKNANILVNLSNNYSALHKFDAADKTLDRAISVAPQSLSAWATKAGLALAAKGDMTFVESMVSFLPAGLDPSGLMTFARVGLLTLKREYAGALQTLAEFPGDRLATPTTAPCPKAFVEGMIYSLQGDKEKAMAALERSRVIAEQIVQEAPEDAERRAQLGLILAGLGQKDRAIAEGKHAVELLPESKDALDGPGIALQLAAIYAWAGEPDEAFRLLERLIHVPNGPTMWLLKLDPRWEPLRKDPRFQKLLEAAAAEPNQ